MLKLKFLGGAEEVGRLGILINMDDKVFQVDYGVIPEKPPLFPLPPEKIDGLFVTHSHLDHIGALPMYYQNDGVDIFATEMTSNTARPMLNDSIKITSIEGYVERFNREDVEKMYTFMNQTKYNEKLVLDEVNVTPYSAGHIPGSTMWKFENSDEIMVTGDLYTGDSKLLNGAKPRKVRNLVVESTYAGKNHEDREEVRKRLRERVSEVVEHGGKVILPSFAMGRMQELIMSLSDLPYKIATDGMGNLITSIYLNTPGYLRSDREFRKALSSVKAIRGKRMRENIDSADVIISTSGMLDGGPVLSYIEKFVHDDKSAIFMTGYQVEGTNGRNLMEKGTLNLSGVEIKPDMAVEFFDMSAHAGHKELLSFIKSCQPENVILCHGDQREAIVDDLENYNVVLPYNGKEFTLD
ncbi:MAG: MBL fold metallo-hydrolase [Candidatus Thermoplasmatota archaeon]|nr:MBL fold metallo-hydrolase [Candidatus Thermoplasmatota archaeon]